MRNRNHRVLVTILVPIPLCIKFPLVNFQQKPHATELCHHCLSLYVCIFFKNSLRIINISMPLISMSKPNKKNQAYSPKMSTSDGNSSIKSLSEISEKETVSFSVDLVAAAKRNLGFLKLVNDSHWLHQKSNILEAIRRYFFHFFLVRTWLFFYVLKWIKLVV